eukprot:PLAT4975.1.p1 GENE.PLAT4975.1~~PLAT4975.1.p1  ORF type:complete len:729 (-),score=323.45 PLAT4975.1:163-2325(-)
MADEAGPSSGSTTDSGGEPLTVDTSDAALVAFLSRGQTLRRGSSMLTDVDEVSPRGRLLADVESRDLRRSPPRVVVTDDDGRASLPRMRLSDVASIAAEKAALNEGSTTPHRSSATSASAPVGVLDTLEMSLGGVTPDTESVASGARTPRSPSSRLSPSPHDDSFGSVGSHSSVVSHLSLKRALSSTTMRGRRQSMPHRIEFADVVGKVKDALSAESLGQVSASRFGRQFIYHILFPFSLPAVLLWEGSVAARNLSMIPHTVTGLLLQWLLPLHLLSLNALLISQPALLSDDLGWLILYCDMLYVLHTMLVAAKYAYMNDTVYEKWCRQPQAAERIARETLIAGWLQPNDAQLAAELSACVTRLGIDVRATRFHVPRHIYSELRPVFNLSGSRWHWRKLREAVVRSAAHHSRRKIELDTVCRHVIRTASQSHRAELVAMALLALLHALAPPTYAALALPHGGSMSFRSPAVAYLSVSLVVQNVVWSFFVLSASMVAVIDYGRRARYMEQLSTLVLTTPHNRYWSGRRRGGTRLRSRVYAADCPPFVDFKEPRNITSWLLARRVLLNYGYRFFSRLQLCGSLLAASTLSLMIWILINLFTRAALTELLFSGVTDLLLLIGLLIAMLLRGARVNSMYKVHSSLLTGQQLQLRTQLLKTHREEERVAILNSDLIMEATIKALDYDDEISAISVMGFRASPRVISTFLTLVVGGLFSGMRAAGP